MKDIKVNENNVAECFKYYEEYKEKFNKRHYSNATIEEFIQWSEDNLKECTNCGNIVLLDEQEHINDDYNSDNVCDECIEELGYYE